MKEIKLTQNKIALVDDEDFEYLSQWRWHAEKGRSTFYAKRTDYSTGKAKSVRMHNEILKVPQIDHKNHNGLDNRKENLRPATTAENNRNHARRRAGKSKYKGVTLIRDKWRGRIYLDNKPIHLGHFDTEEEAALAYNNKAKELFGEFAYLNEI